MAFDKFHLTNTGLAYLQKAQAGQQLRFTKVEIGSGIQPAGYDPTIQYQLVNKLRDIPISRVHASGQNAHISCAFSNADGQGGYLPDFWWTEAGLYAEVVDDPNAPPALYAYTNTMSQAMGDFIPGSTQIEFRFNWIVLIGNAANITAEIDQTLVFITKSEYWDFLKATHEYDFEETPLQVGEGQVELYRYTTRLYKPGSITDVLAVRVMEEQRDEATGLYTYETTITIGASVYKYRYVETSETSGEKRTVI